MKRLTAILLAMLMLAGIGAFSPVSAAEEGIVKAPYTFMDTCYSPELGVYVAVAKDMTHARRPNSQTTPGQIFYSNDGVVWTQAKVPAENRDLIHFANPETAQGVVWWKKEGVFVAVANNKLIISRDGANWTANAAWWHESDGNLRTRSNTTIAVNDNQLVTVTGSVIRTYDSLDEQFAAYQVGSGLNMQAAGVSTDEPTVYFGLAQNYYHIVTGRDETKPPPNTIGTKIDETKTAAPVETVYSEKLGGWIVLNQTDTMHIVTKKATSCVDVKNLSLSNGEKNKAVLSAAAVSGDTVILGNADGNLFTAPLTMDSIKSPETAWELVAPYDDDIKIPAGDAIRSITAINDGMFFFATPMNLYVALKSEDSWTYYDMVKTMIALEGERRIEIPASGSVTHELKAKAVTWKGQQTGGDTASVEVVGTVPEGVSVEAMDDELSVTVSSAVKSGCQFDVKVTAENGQSKTFEILIVDETGVAIEGFDDLLVPSVGESSAQYSYCAVVVGSDGKPMTTRNAVIEVEQSSVPSGVTVEKRGGSEVVFIVTPSAGNASIIVNATSEMNPEYKAKKVIKLSERYVAKVEITSGAESIVISDSEDEKIQYTAQVYDQMETDMKLEHCKWIVSPTVSGVVMDENSGVMTVTPQAVDGTITVRASSKSDETVYAEMEVVLSYTSLRKVEKDIQALILDTSKPLEQDTTLILPSEGNKYKTQITWKSSNTNLLNLVTMDNKLCGMVISPSRSDEKVTLTATVSLDGKAKTKAFEITIKKADTLCINGDFADGTYNGWEKKSEQTTRTILKENEKNVMQVVGDGVYQQLSLNNDSSYGFEAKVKAEAGSTIRLSSQKGGTLATLTANGTYQDIKGSYDYTKQDKRFDERVYLECDSVMTIDNLRVYEITMELNEVMLAVNKAEYSKKTADITAAKKLLNTFYDLPIKDELLKKLDDIDDSQGGNHYGGGGGGGSKAPSSVGGGSAASSAPALPEKKEDNYTDELDTFLLNFKDMKYHWAREDVEYMAGLNLVSGKETGVFAPEDNISRAEFAVLVTRVMGLEQTAYENSFYDIVSDDWYSGYVQTVKSNNFMNGYDGLFRPEAAISREEIAKVIVEAYNSKTGGKLEKGGALYFNDLSDISYWAYDYIVEAVNLGFVNGVSEEIFAPQNIATRAEAAVMLRRVYDKLNAAE